MTINYIKGDLFSTPDRFIVHGCNSQGVMGSGVAKLIREKYPKAYDDYRKKYVEGGNKLDLGILIPSSPQPDKRFIINAITQGGYGYDGQKFASYDAIDMVMKKLSVVISVDDPISMPKIGAGLGGADWNVVEAIIKARLPKHTINVYYL